MQQIEVKDEIVKKNEVKVIELKKAIIEKENKIRIEENR